MLNGVVHFFGEENVVQVVIDNGANKEAIEEMSM